MLLNKSKHINNSRNAGFTIVEVLIALMILSFALGLGYATAGKSSKALQANNEQYQAQQVANQQVEYLRDTNAGLVDNKRNKFNDSTGNCFKNTSGIITVVSGNACKNISAGGADIYTIAIRCVNTARNYANCSNDPDTLSTYSVVVTWTAITGEESRMELQYAM